MLNSFPTNSIEEAEKDYCNNDILFKYEEYLNFKTIYLRRLLIFNIYAQKLFTHTD